MPYHPQKHHRRSIRLKGYDYSQAGLYFITFCCQDRKCLFGKIINNEMILNNAGKMIEREWINLKNRFPQIDLHEFVTMPNHFHGILEIVRATLVVAQKEKGQPQGIAPTEGISPTNETVGDILGAFKSITTVEYIRGVKEHQWQAFEGKVWQRNYWEHIIRNTIEYERISQYIINNPQKWEADKLK